MLHTVVYLGTLIITTAVTTVIMAGWQMILPSLLIVSLGIALGHVYMTAQLPVKRLMSNAKSPILAQVQAAVAGLGSSNDLMAWTTF